MQGLQRRGTKGMDETEALQRGSARRAGATGGHPWRLAVGLLSKGDERALGVTERRKNGRRKRRRAAGCGDGLVLVTGGGAPVAGRRRDEEEARAGRGLREAKEHGLEGLLPSIQIGRRRA